MAIFKLYTRKYLANGK